MRFKTKCSIGFKVLRANIFGLKSPICVYLSATDRCPYQCRYCNIPNRKKKEMSFEQIRHLIDQIYQAGALRLQLVGGEPMMREDIGAIINQAKSKGMFITLSSTGYMIAKKAKELKNVDILFLSFDGEREVHDYHKGNGSYQNLIEAMKCLRENNKKFLTVTTLTAKNKDSIDYILEHARRKNFLTVFQPLCFSGCLAPDHLALSSMPKDLMMSNEDYAQVINKILVAKKKGAPIASSARYLEHLLHWEDLGRTYSNKDNGGRFQCWAGRLYCYIDTDGSVYPCDNTVGLLEGLNCLKQGFWKSFCHLNKNGCQSCIVACEVEKNLMFSLNFATIYNWLKMTG